MGINRRSKSRGNIIGEKGNITFGEKLSVKVGVN